ncbi:MAG: RagB/SusD family nutrient uptake outer membrane protein [Dysgonamonadaceae bacterium]|nr:RagB/SusD family nutrient uptake outer membrane protein [Dysgonamonadaceae bacterium]
MKNKYITVFLLLLFLSGCIEDTLDRKPLNMISDADVWKSEALIDIYMASLYDAIPIGFTNIPYIANLTDESSYHEETPPVSNFGNHWLTLNTTMYTWIRKANYFIDRVQTATVSEEMIKQYIAECRFVRAYYYFDLARKYGGMPIIKEVQVYDNNLEELQVPRDNEEKLYDFILEELDAAIIDLPNTRNAANSNRATKLVAQALKSRAMLYAGTIAKYGTLQLNGLIGIPSSKAKFYFGESMKASKVIMESTVYDLYDKLYDPISQSGDPMSNYQQIFIDKNNKEVIFQKAYSFPDKAHSWDNLNIPEGFTTNQGSAICPLLEMVESYEYIDGTSGVLKVEGLEFNSPSELFKNKDPRFEASVFRSETPYICRPVQISELLP